jgi:uncharacterized protein YqgV (UPF0045/DUF77 family)
MNNTKTKLNPEYINKKEIFAELRAMLTTWEEKFEEVAEIAVRETKLRLGEEGYQHVIAAEEVQYIMKTMPDITRAIKSKLIDQVYFNRN